MLAAAAVATLGERAGSGTLRRFAPNADLVRLTDGSAHMADHMQSRRFCAREPLADDRRPRHEQGAAGSSCVFRRVAGAAAGASSAQARRSVARERR
jgi:hypothetical protein